MSKKIVNKLFLWEGVLSDYTDGVIFALAPDVEAARAAVLERGDGSWEGPALSRAMSGEPTVIPVDQTFGFRLWGGG